MRLEKARKDEQLKPLTFLLPWYSHMHMLLLVHRIRRNPCPSASVACAGTCTPASRWRALRTRPRGAISLPTRARCAEMTSATSAARASTARSDGTSAVVT